VKTIRALPMERVRNELLSLKGVGKETADSILLYAFGFPSFVVDAYTLRLTERLPLPATPGYDSAKAFFEQHLTRETGLYNAYHALVVLNGNSHCRKKPSCSNCPLISICAQSGLSLRISRSD